MQIGERRRKKKNRREEKGEKKNTTRKGGAGRPGKEILLLPGTLTVKEKRRPGD